MIARANFGLRNAYRAMPVIRGVIDRRVLINFNCDPALAAKWLMRNVPHEWHTRGRMILEEA